MNIFEKASRMRIRYSTNKGDLTVEDLWDLPLQSKNIGTVSLDALAIHQNRVNRDASEESFVTERSSVSVEAELKFDVVKYVIAAKISDNAAASTAQADRVHNTKIMDIIARKDDADLEGKSVDQLKDMLKG